MPIIAPPLSAPAIQRLFPRLQVVGTRGKMATTVSTAGANTRWEGFTYHNIGPRPVTSVQVVFLNRLLGTASESITSVTTMALEAALRQNGDTQALTFGGSLNPSVPPGAAWVITDELGLPLNAGQEIQIRCGAVTAAGAVVPIGMTGNRRSAFQSTAATSQVYLDGEGMSTPPGGAGMSTSMTPLAILGVPDRRHVAALLWGDSIMNGADDVSDAFGYIGWAERGMIGAGAVGIDMPFVNVSRGSSTTASYTNQSLAGTRWNLAQYCTHVVFGMSVNDVAGGVSLATMQANCQYAWATARRGGCKAWHTTMTPRTTSTDSWATLANQTVVANYTQAGIRGQFNAWLLAQVAAGNLDGVIDVAAAVQDATEPEKWKVNGTANFATADGLHPSVAMHTAMAAVLTPIAQQWTA